jgi:hypothetical protein
MHTVTDPYALKILRLFKKIFDKGLGKTPSKIEFEPEDFNLRKNIPFHGSFHQFYLPHLQGVYFLENMEKSGNLKSYGKVREISKKSSILTFFWKITNFNTNI